MAASAMLPTPQGDQCNSTCSNKIKFSLHKPITACLDENNIEAEKWFFWGLAMM